MIRKLIALFTVTIFLGTTNVWAADTVTIEDEDGNTIHQDAKGNVHVEDEDGNYVKLDKHGNVREVEDEDGNRVMVN